MQKRDVAVLDSAARSAAQERRQSDGGGTANVDDDLDLSDSTELDCASPESGLIRSLQRGGSFKSSSALLRTNSEPLLADGSPFRGGAKAEDDDDDDDG